MNLVSANANIFDFVCVQEKPGVFHEERAL